MPITVPKSPMNGALLPSVPRKARRRSSRMRCSAVALAMASSAASGPRASCFRPAATIAAFCRLRGCNQIASAVEVVGVQAVTERFGKLCDVFADHGEEPTALDHDRDAHDAEREHQVHDRGGTEFEQNLFGTFDDVRVHGSATKHGTCQHHRGAHSLRFGYFPANRTRAGKRKRTTVRVTPTARSGLGQLSPASASAAQTPLKENVVTRSCTTHLARTLL